MGGCDFTARAHGKTAADAYANAVADAQYERGHGGYTGTIAEKRGFKLVPVPNGANPMDAVHWIASPTETPAEHTAWAERWHQVYEDKWGPACCIELAAPITAEPGVVGKFVFFGIASS